jgi:hypothetical protein
MDAEPSIKAEQKKEGEGRDGGKGHLQKDDFSPLYWAGGSSAR